VISREPLRLAITSTGLDKASLTPAQFLEMDEAANVVRGDGRPSAEALLHLAIARGVDAGANLAYAFCLEHDPFGLACRTWRHRLGRIEMLKGLEGVRTHKHREWLPILENSQDMIELGERVSKTLRESPGIHGFLLKGHGLYTWGAGLQEAKRHVKFWSS